LRLQRFRGFHHQETKRHAALFAIYRMMKTVRQPEPLQVALARHPVERPALMHQAIMNQKIEYAVERHASANPL